jgi:hypothetical protein
VHLITSYPSSSDSSSPKTDGEIEIPLPAGPCNVWLSAATVIACEVNAGLWPEWTDEWCFGLGPGGKR